jgi:hypothetical protein
MSSRAGAVTEAGSIADNHEHGGNRVTTKGSPMRSYTHIWRAGIGAAAALSAATLALGASPAGAIIANIRGHGYGITPIAGINSQSIPGAGRALGSSRTGGAGRARRFDGPPFGGGRLETAGGPVMHRNTTHLIYWDPNNEFTAVTKGIIRSFFTNVAQDSGLTSNVFAITGQYTDATGHAAYDSTFEGERTDPNGYPTLGDCTAPSGEKADPGPYPTCLFDSQLQTELSRYVGEQGLPTGPTQLYFLLLPHTIATCLPPVEEGEQVCSNNFFCAYHSYINPGSPSEIIYADIPFSLLDKEAKRCQNDGTAGIQQPNPDNGGSEESNTRFADVALKYISHEAIEAITDPLVNEETAWTDENGLEIGDKCNGVTPDGEEDGIGYDASSFTPTLGGIALSDNLFNQSINNGSYYLQSEWDNGGNACLMKPLSISGAVFVASSGTAGSPVSFSGNAVDPYGSLELSWSFGDGSVGGGTMPSHTYAAAGNYTVAVTPKDGLTGSTGAPFSQTIAIAPAPVKSAAVTTTPPPPPPPPTPPPNSNFTAVGATLNARTGAITFTELVGDPGTFSWLLTFQNGKFGVFAAGNAKCKSGFVKLSGKCRRSKIVFGRGRMTVLAAGRVSFTVKPSASAFKALKDALRQKKQLAVTIDFSFQSSLGGSPVSHTQSLTVKLKKK